MSSSHEGLWRLAGELASEDVGVVFRAEGPCPPGVREAILLSFSGHAVRLWQRYGVLPRAGDSERARACADTACFRIAKARAENAILGKRAFAHHAIRVIKDTFKGVP